MKTISFLSRSSLTAISDAADTNCEKSSCSCRKNLQFRFIALSDAPSPLANQNSSEKHMTSTLRITVIAATLLCLAQVATAVTLQAKVTEVRSGNTLIVSNINRPISVRLKAVIPPEVGQPFNDVAREHLRALVLDKTVTIEYSHLADSYLEAKVFLNNVDIGSQMLRDGVAWYDHALDYELTQSDRDLYAQCENAARAEKRGLWQDQSPVAPWEYRRLQAAQLARISGSTSLRQTAKSRTKSGLSSEDLFSGMMSGPMPANGSPNVKPISEKGTPDRWTKYES